MARITLPLTAFLLLALGTAARAAPQGKDDAVVRELKLLDGTWEVVSIVTDGQEVSRRADTGLYSLTLEKGKFAYKTRDGKVLDDGTFRVDPAAEPKAIDLSARGGMEVSGIYELKGDELKVCVGKERPAKLTSEAGGGRTLITYKRVK